MLAKVNYNNSNKQITSVVPKSLETKLRDSGKQKGWTISESVYKIYTEKVVSRWMDKSTDKQGYTGIF